MMFSLKPAVGKTADTKAANKKVLMMNNNNNVQQKKNVQHPSCRQVVSVSK